MHSRAARIAVLALAAATVCGCGSGKVQRPATDDLTATQLAASCDFADLDGTSGLEAADIPVAHTPGCGYTTFPDPVLARCTEPLAAGSVDLRGVWLDTAQPRGHLERIEQCGDRIAITAGHVLHDMRTDGTYEHGVNDVAARDCSRISVRAEFVDGVHTLHPQGLPVTVTRRLDGDTLVWDYPTGVYRLTRLCGPGMHADLQALATRLRADAGSRQP